jgi:outer membrane receptor protein involved in Fe transport
MGGIINIVLKDDADTGLGGTVTAGVDTQGGYSGTGMLSYGNGPLTLTGSYGFRQDEGVGGGESFRINRYADPLTFLDQNEDEDESGTSHNATLSADYALSPKTTLTSSVQFGLQDEVENELNTYLELDADQAPTLNYQRQVDENDDRWNADVRVGLQHDFGTPSARSGARPGASMGRRGRWGRRGGGRSSGGAGLGSHSLSAEARYNTFVNDGLETYTEEVIGTGELRELQQAQTDREREEASLTVDYVRPLGAMRLETGYKGELERLHSDFFSQTLDQTTGEFAPDVDLNNVFDFDQQIHAVYGQLAHEWGPLGVQAGLRFEVAQTTFTLQNTNESYDNDYTSLFPSTFFTYTLNETNTLKASYSRRVNRPRTWFLNPFPSYDDPLNLRVGNPFLEPEYIDAIEAGYVRFTSWGSLTLTPYYRRTTNVIRRYQEIRDDGVTVRTVENFDTRDAFGLELISSFQGKGVLDGLRGFASLEGYQINTDGSSVDADLQNNAFGWGGRLNMTYQLGSQLGWGGLDLQGNVFYRAPRDTEQGRIGSFTFFNLALRQQFMNDRANLTLRVRDPFDLAGFSYELDQPTLYQELERDWGAQQVGLTFSYSFGQQDRQRNQNRDRGERGGGDFDDMEM